MSETLSAVFKPLRQQDDQYKSKLNEYKLIIGIP